MLNTPVVTDGQKLSKKLLTNSLTNFFSYTITLTNLQIFKLREQFNFKKLLTYLNVSLEYFS